MIDYETYFWHNEVCMIWNGLSSYSISRKDKKKGETRYSLNYMQRFYKIEIKITYLSCSAWQTNVLVFIFVVFLQLLLLPLPLLPLLVNLGLQMFRSCLDGLQTLLKLRFADWLDVLGVLRTAFHLDVAAGWLAVPYELPGRRDEPNVLPFSGRLGLNSIVSRLCSGFLCTRLKGSKEILSVIMIRKRTETGSTQFKQTLTVDAHHTSVLWMK